MDLHPIGFDKLVEITTERVSVVIKTKNRSQNINADFSSSLAITGAIPECIKICEIPVIVKRDNKAVNGLVSINVPPIFFEQTDYEIVIRGINAGEIYLWHENYSIRERVGYVGENKDLITGIINFGNEVGFSEFEISVDGERYMTIKIEVYPSKISYKEDYKNMLIDISEEVYGIAIDFIKRTYSELKIGEQRQDVPAIFFQIMRQLYDKFLNATRRIVAIPHHKLISEHQIQAAHKVRTTDRSTNAWLLKHPECAEITGSSIVASKALAVKKSVTYNTVENQFVKFILIKTLSRLKSFEERYRISGRKYEEAVFEALNKMQSGLRGILNSSFLRSVDNCNTTRSMSLVFEMAPGYKELYRYYLMLQRGLELNGDVFKMSLKDTAQLYEYWCVIKLASILRRNYRLISPDIIRVDRSGIVVALVKGEKSEIKYINPRTDEKITLTYNPGEKRTPTVNQKPDNVLTLEKSGSDVPYMYVFDAKYRIENRPGGIFYPDKNPGPKLEDINAMHRYRDAMVYENASSSRFIFEKTMFGAYVLFPYADEERYKQHHFYKSIDTVNIGGLPFLPGATSLVEGFLAELVGDSEESAFERATLPRGIERRIQKVDWEVKDVLVGSVRSEAQLQNNISGRFYYVPAKYIKPDQLPVRIVAIYQSAYSKNPGIKFYGDVLTTQRVKRKQIGTEMRSNNPDEDYYLFEIKEWKILSKAIEARSDYVDKPRFTNSFLLRNCRSVYELFSINSYVEYRLIFELNRIFERVELDEKEAGIIIRVNESRSILIDKDWFEVVDKEGKTINKFSVDQFRKNPRMTFNSIKRDCRMTII